MTIEELKSLMKDKLTTAKDLFVETSTGTYKAIPTELFTEIEETLREAELELEESKATISRLEAHIRNLESELKSYEIPTIGSEVEIVSSEHLVPGIICPVVDIESEGIIVLHDGDEVLLTAGQYTIISRKSVLGNG
ncbi:hypothetical protein LIS04_149 [Listeria phage LIS04]|nr:hypothetical protein LIS04_149 [Listeria phage LIS04]